MFSTLISAHELKDFQEKKSHHLCVVDCSFDLSKVDQGKKQYQEGHLPIAHYLDLNRDLSALAPSQMRVSGGRHPLPTKAAFQDVLTSLGINNQTQVVVYDRQGSMFSPRLWWMLKWMGHEHVAVLDGGWQSWLSAGFETSCPASGNKDQEKSPSDAPKEKKRGFKAPLVALRVVDEVLRHLNTPTQTIVDARGAARYRGDDEPLDLAAGHIPGALNRPFTDNFGSDGKFKSPSQLRSEWLALLGDKKSERVVHQCGSGVTACCNVLSMELAGLNGSSLYAGSWSEWCSEPSRPVAKG